MSLVVMVGFGSLFYAYSVLITDEAAGAVFSTSLLSTAYGGFVLIGGLLAFVVGRYADRHGVRGVVGVGAALGAAGLVAVGAAQSGAHVVVASWVLMGPAGAMVLYEPAFVAVDQWFGDAGRGRAIAVLTVIAGLAGPIFVPLTGWLVTSVGWRTTTKVLALCVAAVGVVGVALIPGTGGPRPSGTADRPRVRALLRDTRFLWYTAAVVLFYGALQAVFFHRIAAFEEVGSAVAAVAGWAGISGLLGFPGRWLAPRVAARFAHMLQAALLLVLAASVAMIVAAPGRGLMPAHFIVFGLAFGALLPLRPVIMADWFSGSAFGHIMGTQWSMAALAGAAAPWLVGIGRDFAGGYDGPLVVVLVALVVGAVLTLRAARSPAAH